MLKQYIAWFFNDKGEYDGSKKFTAKDKTIKYKTGSYNVDIKNGSDVTSTVIPLILERKRFFYNMSYSNPYNFNKVNIDNLQEMIKNSKKKEEAFIEPPISPELYNINLETKVARDLNDLAKGGILDFFKNPSSIIIFLAIIGVAIYLLTGNKLTP